MNTEELNYCDFRHNDKIAKVLHVAYPEMNWDAIVDIYSKMKNEFDGVSAPEMLVVDRFPFFQESLLEGILNEYRSTEYTIGIDLPVWINPKQNFNNKYVMILGEDPLRSNHFQEQNEKSKIIISSPFGTHSKLRREGYNSLMWKISQRILSTGYGLYYTDINKLWIGKHDTSNSSNKPSRPRKMTLPQVLRNNFDRTLQEEINLMNPIIAIAFGKVAQEALRSIDMQKTQKKCFPHTAARAKSWLPHTNGKPANYDNIIEAVVNGIPTLLK